MAEGSGSSNAPVVAIVVFVVIVIILLFIFHPWDEGPRIIKREKTEQVLPGDSRSDSRTPFELPEGQNLKR